MISPSRIFYCMTFSLLFASASALAQTSFYVSAEHCHAFGSEQPFIDATPQGVWNSDPNASHSVYCSIDIATQTSVNPNGGDFFVYDGNPNGAVVCAFILVDSAGTFYETGWKSSCATAGGCCANPLSCGSCSPLVPSFTGNATISPPDLYTSYPSGGCSVAGLTSNVWSYFGVCAFPAAFNGARSGLYGFRASVTTF